MNKFFRLRARLRSSIGLIAAVLICGTHPGLSAQEPRPTAEQRSSIPLQVEEATAEDTAGNSIGSRPSPKESAGLSSTSTGQAPARLAAKEEKFSLPLAALIDNADPVTLRGGTDELHFTVRIPELWRPTQMALTLAGSFSNALIGVSQLAIDVNGLVVQQFPLESEDKRFNRSMALPTEAFKSGDNDIRIKVVQQSTLTCERPVSPELWTQIDVGDSVFTMQALPKPVPARVNALDALFESAEWLRRPVVPVLTASSPTAKEISALSLIAQGIGSRYANSPVTLKNGRFPASPAALSASIPTNSRGAVVLGTFAKLAPYLDGLEVPPQSGPIIAVRSLPNDSSRFIVIIGAENEAELAKAATAFAMDAIPWPDHPWVAVNSLVLRGAGDRTSSSASSPTASLDSIRAGLSIMPLKGFGFESTTFTGPDQEVVSLRIWNNRWRGRLQVRVHLAYASGMSPQSALNVLTNGTLHGSIPLNNPDGGRYYNYAVSIPTGSLKPGWNTLQFKPVLIPISNGEQCKAPDGNLAATLYDDTVVEVSGGNDLQKSDLALLAGLGSSYADGEMGRNLAVHLTDNGADTVSAGLTMVAKLAQVFPGPLIDSTLTVGEAAAAANNLWVGPYDKLPGPIKKLMPAAPSGLVTLQVPLLEHVSVPAPVEKGFLDSLQQYIVFGGNKRPNLVEAEVKMSEAFTKNSFAFTGRWDDRNVSVFTAGTPWLLEDGINTIIDPDQWKQMRGNLAFWLPGDNNISAISFEDTPFSAYGLQAGLGIWLSHYPWFALLGLLFAIAILVLLTRSTLHFYRRRKNARTDL